MPMEEFEGYEDWATLESWMGRKTRRPVWRPCRHLGKRPPETQRAWEKTGRL